MIKRISALIWLRTQTILSNGAMLFQIVFPYGMLHNIHDHFMNKDGPTPDSRTNPIHDDSLASFICRIMITIMLAEEKEKKKLEKHSS